MNEQERAELERLKQMQSELLARLADLGRKIVSFEARLVESDKAAQAKAAVPQPAEPPSEPKLDWVSPPPEPSSPPIVQPAVSAAIPPVISAAIPSAPVTESTVNKLLDRREPPASAAPPPVVQVPAAASETAPPPLPPAPPPRSPHAPAPGKPKGSFEMQLGTYWLVRVGIVMVVTGLVFFGTYAYHNYMGRLTPGAKVALLYLASGVLLGVGAWLQRGEEKLRNYAQVLMAGGLAAVYFTTYAAHHIPRLQIITSATIDGLLLLLWATFIIWIADRKKSEVIAFFAVLLAYYTSAITHVGLFTLYSNLLLALAAVFFLIRNRWAVLSFAALSATYAGYVFWRFYHDGEWGFVSADEGLWTGVYFLIAYWAIFTAAVFLSNHEKFADSKRAGFLTLNNAAFFSTFVLTMAQVHQGGFWKFSLITGSVFTALSFLSKRFKATDLACSNAYLVQGVLLVTVGFVAYYTGLKLGLVLGVESFILVVVGQQMKNRVLQGSSLVVALLAAWWVSMSIEPFDHPGMVSGAAVGALLLLNAFWLRRETTPELSATHPRTLCFTILALTTWLVTTWQNTRPEWRGFVIVAESVGFLFAVIPLANRVLMFGSYGFAAIGALIQLHEVSYPVRPFSFSGHVADFTGLLPTILMGILLVVNAVSEQERLKGKNREEFQGPVVFFSVTSLAAWLVATWVFTPPEYMAALFAAEAVVFTASLYIFRVREIAFFGQGFLVFAQCLWLYDVFNREEARPWWNAASIISITLLLALWWQRQKSLTFKETYLIQLLQGAYALAVVGLTYYWLQPHFTPPQWIAFTSLLAIVATVYGAVTRQWLLAAFGQLFLCAAAGHFCWQIWDGKPDWYFALVPMATAAALSLCAVKWLEAYVDTKKEIRDTVLQVGLVYRTVAVAMALWWLHKYIPAREQFWVAVVVGLALFLAAGWRRSQELLIFSAIFTAAGVSRFLLPWHGADTVYLPNLVAILLIAAQQQMARRMPKGYALIDAIHTTVILLVGVCIWRLLTLWILELVETADASYLTAGWSVLAFVMFITGMTLRERVYRWMGLGLLTCAVGRVILIDVWKLQTIYQILSFLALGIVLLVLGFIYNKYQEKIRQWL